MCQSLVEVFASMRHFSVGFDPTALGQGELQSVVRRAGAIEKMCATVGALAAAEMAARAGEGEKGTRSAERKAAEDLARATGTSLHDAKRALVAAKVMASQPELADAARSGQLSRDQVSLIAIAGEKAPDAVARLVESSRTSSLSELADEAAKARAAAEDLDERRRRSYAERKLADWTDPYGNWHLSAQGPPDLGALVMAALRPLEQAAFEAARKQGRQEGHEAYGFDALVAMATGGGGGAPRAEVMVRVDHSALLRGYPIDDEVCEVPGFGTVSPQVVRDMVESGDTFLKAIVTKGKDVIGVAHLGRYPNAHQKSALDWLYPTCAAERCGVRAEHLQTDHRADWAKTHFTLLDLLDRLCPRHHRMKTNDGWALVEGKGKRAFVSPSDPRHPRHARRE